MNRLVAQRFWSHVALGESYECWPYLGHKRGGYGRFNDEGKVRSAHRVAFELVHGPIAPALTIDHLCHNGTDCKGGATCPHRACCNPAHLDAVSLGINSGRSHNSYRARTHCPQGHPYDSANTIIRPKQNSRRVCRACLNQYVRRWKAQRRAVAHA